MMQTRIRELCYWQLLMGGHSKPSQPPPIILCSTLVKPPQTYRVDYCRMCPPSMNRCFAVMPVRPIERSSSSGRKLSTTTRALLALPVRQKTSWCGCGLYNSAGGARCVLTVLERWEGSRGRKQEKQLRG